ncbi:hypothetical protein, partial [Candidatus Accumulibacter cognatus]|uniref:hypothetical protein n=1 Tax=Candidatus Accumulibacter cognatus TaxID=2954383 RepID=UPI00235B6CE5
LPISVYPSHELSSVWCIIHRESYVWLCGMTAPAHTNEVDRTSVGQMLYGDEILSDVVTVRYRRRGFDARSSIIMRLT